MSMRELYTALRVTLLLTLIGGAALVLLGARTLVSRPSTEMQTQSEVSGLAFAYFSTLGLTMTNPATIIAFAALVASLGIGMQADSSSIRAKTTP